jgi:hypothetical protein
MTYFKALMTITFSLILLNTYGQNIISVDDSQTAIADYNTLSEAIDNAVDGDIIYIYPGTYSGRDTIDKQITIYGTGYFLDQNQETQISFIDAHLNLDLYLTEGSEGSTIYGVRMDDIIILNSKNIIVANCSIDGARISESSEISLTQNYLSYLSIGESLNINTNNNVFNSSGSHSVNATDQNSNLRFNNNYIDKHFNCKECICENNIFNSSVSPNDNIYNNNLFILEHSLIGNNNLFNVDLDEVFLGYSEQGNYSDDGRYQLKNVLI